MKQFNRFNWAIVWIQQLNGHWSLYGPYDTHPWDGGESGGGNMVGSYFHYDSWRWGSGHDTAGYATVKAPFIQGAILGHIGFMHLHPVHGMFFNSRSG